MLGKGKTTKRGDGGHEPDPQRKTKVEQSAIDLTTRHFEKLNYVIESVEGDNVGWDLDAVHSQTGTLLRLEVKGLSGAGVNVEMTPNEYKMMKKHKQTYRVCVGTNCLKNPIVDWLSSLLTMQLVAGSTGVIAHWKSPK